MSLRVKVIVLVSDFDARKPLGQTATEFLVEEDNASIGRETVAFVAADTFQKAIQVAGLAHLMPSEPGVIQTLQSAPKDPRRDAAAAAIGELARKVWAACTQAYLDDLKKGAKK